MGSLPGLTQKALDSVVEWGQEFTLAMNGAKTVDMVISARREDNIPSPPSPVISGHAISRVSTFKLLGVQISSDLSWDAHVKYMISKVRPRIYYLCAAKKAGLPCDVLVQVYLTFIRPVLEYASPVWVVYLRSLWGVREDPKAMLSDNRHSYFNSPSIEWEAWGSHHMYSY